MTKLEKQLKETYGIINVMAYVESMRLFEEAVKVIKPRVWEDAWDTALAEVS